jgi:hypothetical protein
MLHNFLFLITKNTNALNVVGLALSNDELSNIYYGQPTKGKLCI